MWINPTLGIPPSTTYRRLRRLQRAGRIDGPRPKGPPMPRQTQPALMMPDVPLDDAGLAQHLEHAYWHTSRGYVRGDGFPVGGHQYILLEEEPYLFAVLRERVRNGPGGYDGVYGRYRHHYLNLAGWKYWATFDTVLNREKLPDHA